MSLTMTTATDADGGFLAEMLFEALFVPPGEEPFPRSILDEPDIAHYVAGFPGREGDLGIIAKIDGEPAGAVWVRQFSADDPGYGWVDAETRELSIAVEPSHQGAGVGSALLTSLFAEIGGSKRISLSVDTRSRAFDLYLRFGFVVVGEDGPSATMLKRT